MGIAPDKFGLAVGDHEDDTASHWVSWITIMSIFVELFEALS